MARLHRYVTSHLLIACIISHTQGFRSNSPLLWKSIKSFKSREDRLAITVLLNNSNENNEQTPFWSSVDEFMKVVLSRNGKEITQHGLTKADNLKKPESKEHPRFKSRPKEEVAGKNRRRDGKTPDISQGSYGKKYTDEKNRDVRVKRQKNFQRNDNSRIRLEKEADREASLRYFDGREYGDKDPSRRREIKNDNPRIRLEETPDKEASLKYLDRREYGSNKKDSSRRQEIKKNVKVRGDDIDQYTKLAIDATTSLEKNINSTQSKSSSQVQEKRQQNENDIADETPSKSAAIIQSMRVGDDCAKKVGSSLPNSTIIVQSIQHATDIKRMQHRVSILQHELQVKTAHMINLNTTLANAFEGQQIAQEKSKKNHRRNVILQQELKQCKLVIAKLQLDLLATEAKITNTTYKLDHTALDALNLKKQYENELKSMERRLSLVKTFLTKKNIDIIAQNETIAALTLGLETSNENFQSALDETEKRLHYTGEQLACTIAKHEAANLTLENMQSKLKTSQKALCKAEAECDADKIMIENMQAENQKLHGRNIILQEELNCCASKNSKNKHVIQTSLQANATIQSLQIKVQNMSESIMLMKKNHSNREVLLDNRTLILKFELERVTKDKANIAQSFSNKMLDHKNNNEKFQRNLDDAIQQVKRLEIDNREKDKSITRERAKLAKRDKMIVQTTLNLKKVEMKLDNAVSGFRDRNKSIVGNSTVTSYALESKQSNDNSTNASDEKDNESKISQGGDAVKIAAAAFKASEKRERILMKRVQHLEDELEQGQSNGALLNSVSGQQQKVQQHRLKEQIKNMEQSAQLKEVYWDRKVKELEESVYRMEDDIARNENQLQSKLQSEQLSVDSKNKKIQTDAETRLLLDKLLDEKKRITEDQKRINVISDKQTKENGRPFEGPMHHLKSKAPEVKTTKHIDELSETSKAANNQLAKTGNRKSRFVQVCISLISKPKSWVLLLCGQRSTSKTIRRTEVNDSRKYLNNLHNK